MGAASTPRLAQSVLEKKERQAAKTVVRAESEAERPTKKERWFLVNLEIGAK
jgi:hypothetical protein